MAFVLLLALARQVACQSNGPESYACIIKKAPAIYMQSGAICTLLFQEKIQSHAGYGLAVGFGIRRYAGANVFMLFQLNYQQFTYAGMESHFYDAGSGTSLRLITGLKMNNLEFPLLFGLEQKKFSAALGLAVSFLLSARVSQEADASGSTNAIALAGKYKKTNVRDLSSFYSGNLAPCLYLAWVPFRRFSLSWTVSCDLLENPIPEYSYFSPYRFIQNKFGITFKISDS